MEQVRAVVARFCAGGLAHNRAVLPGRCWRATHVTTRSLAAKARAARPSARRSAGSRAIQHSPREEEEEEAFGRQVVTRLRFALPAVVQRGAPRETGVLTVSGGRESFR